jgi:hypothetical protein
MVTVHLWSVPARRVPDLLARTTVWRLGRAGPRPDFVKLLGTTSTGRYDVRATDPLRWLLLASWPDRHSAASFEAGPLARAWSAVARQAWRATLVPLSGHGRWAGRQPFRSERQPWDRQPFRSEQQPCRSERQPLRPGSPGRAPVGGPLVVLTRARLRLRSAPRFWRAIPEVGRLLAGQPGLRVGFGIGEAPIGWQGTLSVWDSAAAAEAFAFRAPSAHVAAIRAARTERWYAEELFARFALRDSAGTIDGRDPLR